MDAKQFVRILKTFADNASDIDLAKGEFALQVRGEILQAEAYQRDMALHIRESGTEYTAEGWISERLARLPQLALRILDFIPEESCFVDPSCKFLDILEKDPTENISIAKSTVPVVQAMLNVRAPFCSSVLYLTSDAGEGKTTVIHRLARAQAQAFLNKESDWILLPIPLSGKPFLRFDDIVIASLANRFRFQFLYWESFLELVKAGKIVPAFDGFEEMFVESTTEEALSALGNLLNALDAQGTVLISARKAYFDYKSLVAQAKLYDTIRSDYVTFSRITIDRWGREQFLEYADKRCILEANQMYDRIERRLTVNHPILTRAVLVKRLLDVAETLDESVTLMDKLGETPDDYFHGFVNAIIEREVGKWIDTSGEPAKPLIALSQHHKLLAAIAEEMWITSTESLKAEMLDLICDLFAEEIKIDSRLGMQIKERIKQHALLVQSKGSRTEFSFDHNEFYEFFLGKALAGRIIQKDSSEAKRLLRINVLPQHASLTAANMLRRESNIELQVLFLQQLCSDEAYVSYVRENAGAIVGTLLPGLSGKAVVLDGMTIAVNSLTNISVRNVTFKNCFIKSNSLGNSTIENCIFDACSIERLILPKIFHLTNVVLNQCDIQSILLEEDEKEVFDPNGIVLILKSKGFIIPEEKDKMKGTITEYKEDEDLMLTEKALRRFIRSNQINENIFRLRLGPQANHFLESLLPQLLEVGIIQPASYSGHGQQDRYRLSVPMEKVLKALQSSRGTFSNFLAFFKLSALHKQSM